MSVEILSTAAQQHEKHHSWKGMQYIYRRLRDYLVVNFRRSVILVELRRPEVARRWNFVRNCCVFFLKNDPLERNFQNYVPIVYTETLIDVVVFKFCEIRPTGNRWNRALFIVDQKNNKNSAACQTVVTARITPKICQGQPPTMHSKCSRFHPNRFTFDKVIAERVNTAKLPHKVNPIFVRSLLGSESNENGK